MEWEVGAKVVFSDGHEGEVTKVYANGNVVTERSNQQYRTYSDGTGRPTGGAHGWRDSRPTIALSTPERIEAAKDARTQRVRQANACRAEKVLRNLTGLIPKRITDEMAAAVMAVLAASREPAE